MSGYLGTRQSVLQRLSPLTLSRISVGFALIDHSTVTDTEVLVEADRAMYAVKRDRAAQRIGILR